MNEEMAPNEPPRDETDDDGNGTDELAKTQLHWAGKSPAESDIRQLPGGRYHVVGEIDRGGMGVVLRVIDSDLQRPLAVKVMQGPADSGRPQRFLEEARITGQLQHPGIAPVHEIGRLEDGRPFFAMKLIAGRTLADLLRERTSPASDLPRFLKIFEQIAQTLAYAHSQGIIHRDLKPANVMVGAFGEVQVMDWGLARRLTEAEPAAAAMESIQEAIDEETLPPGTSPTPADRLTHHGQVLGTPAYMPPEQARGEIESLSERSDVFGLGAILCAILTGQPPYELGKDAKPLEQAARGDLSTAWARLAECGADAELIELAQACLSPDAAERPADAGGVAQRVSAYLNSVQERLKQAAIDQAAAEAKAVEERKRRRVGMALLASLVLLVATVGGAAAWFLNDRADRAAEEAEQRVLAQSKRKQAESDISASLNDAARIREELLGILGDRLRAHTLMDNPGNWRGKLDAALALVRRAESLARQVEVGSGLVDRTATLTRQIEADLAGQQFAEKLEKIRMDAGALVEGKFDTSQAAGDYDVEFQAGGLPILTGDPVALAAQIQASSIRPFLVAALDDWAMHSLTQSVRQRVLQIARLADPDPEWRDRMRDPANWSRVAALQELAAECDLKQQSPQILVLLGVRMKLAKIDPAPFLRVVQRQHPSDFWVNFVLGDQASDPNDQVGFYRAALAVRPHSAVTLNNMGLALSDTGDLDGAIAAYGEALLLDPKYVKVHNNLGLALHDKGDLEGAIAAYHQALAIDPHYKKAHNNLGIALDGKGDWKGAIASYRRALAIDPNYAHAHKNLGDALRSAGELEGAIAVFRQWTAIDPRNASAHIALGHAHHAKGDVDSAIAACRQALAVDRKNANAHLALGFVLGAKGDLDGAIAAYRQAAAIDPKDATIYNRLGNALANKGDVDGAVAAFRQAFSINPKYGSAPYNLANSLRDKGDVDGAIAAYRQALAISPKDAKAHHGLGLALYDKKDLDGAIAAYRASLAIDPRNAIAQNNLGNVLSRTRDVDGAIAAYRQALANDPKYAKAHYNLGSALGKKGDVEGAIAAYGAALKFAPKYVKASFKLGETLRQKGDWGRAIAAFRRVVALDPTHADARTHLGAALYTTGDVEGAIATFRRLISMVPKHQTAHLNLGIILHGKGDLQGAVACYRKAAAIDPKQTVAHTSLGRALLDTGDVDGAIVAFRRSLAINPKQDRAYNGLGLALQDKKDLDGAMAAYRQAIAIAPKSPIAVYNLGNALREKGDLEAAIATYRRAIAIDPKHANSYTNLGAALLAKRDSKAAIDAFRQRIKFGPKDAMAHYNLASALRDNGDLEGALAACRQALAVDAKFAEAYSSLGNILKQQGKFNESLQAFRRAHEIGSPRKGWPYPSAAWVAQAERLVELNGKLPAVLAGEAAPADTAERLEMARLLLHYKKTHYAQAARLYAQAFKAEPKYADDIRAEHRYNAACAALLAIAKGGNEKLDDEERATWRRQARQWLQADLEARARLLERDAKTASFIGSSLQLWQTDADLAGVRDKAALAKLPPDEQPAWRQLWAGVAALAKRCKGTINKAKQ